MRITILYTGDFGKRVIGNLINMSTFCISCGELCDECRSTRKSYAGMLLEIYELPDNLPMYIEDPQEYMPPSPGECDLIIAIGIHSDILLELPTFVKQTGAKGVIVPIEDPGWAPAGLRQQVRDKLEAMGVDCEFPKPFCSLIKCGKPIIDEFISLGFGRPKLDITVEDGVITHAALKRDAPCGCTWYVAKKLNWTDVADYKETVSSAHHAYPCTASMDRDTELGDTILHAAGYIIREAVEEGLGDSVSEN